MRWLSAALCVVSVACGRSPFGIGAAAGADGDTGKLDGADDDPAGAEADDGDGGDDDDGDDGEDGDDGDDGDDDDGDGVVCRDLPDVRNVWVYDGEALETVGEDLLAHSDGFLYLSGTAADDATMYMWLASASYDGTLLWEELSHPRAGTNLSGWRPVATDLASDGNALAYAGNTYDEAPVGLFGYIDPVAPVFVPSREEPGAAFYGVLPVVSGHVLAGRAYGDVDGARLGRRGTNPWDQVTPESGSFHEIAAAVARFDDDWGIVAGRTGDLPWIGLFRKDTGDFLWSATVGQATFEVETGAFWSVASDGERAYAAGFVYQTKPKRDEAGSWSFGEIFVAAYDREGGLAWTWQRSSTTVRPGDANALALGEDGTVFVAGEESEFYDDPALFVSAFSPEGDVLWQLDDLGRGDLTGLIPVGIAPGDPGQLFVLADTYGTDGLRKTALVEICY